MASLAQSVPIHWQAKMLRALFALPTPAPVVLRRHEGLFHGFASMTGPRS